MYPREHFIIVVTAADRSADFVLCNSDGLLSVQIKYIYWLKIRDAIYYFGFSICNAVAVAEIVSGSVATIADRTKNKIDKKNLIAMADDAIQGKNKRVKRIALQMEIQFHWSTDTHCTYICV